MLNAIIVDDEAPARSELRFLLDEVGGVEVTAEAANVREAIEKLKEYPCDVMFMDVNMPEATGLQLAEALQHLKFPPAVVFVTAYSEHALDAFKVSAIDYLVKPVETERLAQAIARVREQVALHLQAHKSERIPFQDLALVFTAGIVIPWMLSSLVRLGLNDPKAPYLLLPFVITWLSDSGAFFVGRSLGKTKLAPALSPHKTVEGCVGGFVCAIAAAMLYGLVLHLCGYRVQIGLLAIYGFFGSLAGQAGDLAFSAIKREHGVKDYSNLLPGHGGMLDRFDSTIFTAPMLELLVLLAPAISVVAK